MDDLGLSRGLAVAGPERGPACGLPCSDGTAPRHGGAARKGVAKRAQGWQQDLPSGPALRTSLAEMSKPTANNLIWRCRARRQDVFATPRQTWWCCCVSRRVFRENYLNFDAAAGSGLDGTNREAYNCFAPFSGRWCLFV